MKFTSFHPLIVTKDAQSTIAVFEALGFEKRHTITVRSSSGRDVTSVNMKSPDGFYVDVAQADHLESDLTLIRMNVDDFGEAYDMLTDKGFVNSAGDKTVDSKTNTSAMMIAPSGFAFDLCHHIKEQ
ncbi:MAG: hypothetical protein IJ125_06090 [Atopobiaceae bacterium]|nr:hypothetical protein [Atopobiaceae bacterium]